MGDDELEALLDELEAGLSDEVGRVLGRVIAEWAAGVDAADELTAAAFSVRSIASIWRRLVAPLADRVRAVARRGVSVSSDLLGQPQVPAEDADRRLDEHVALAVDQLEGVGDTLADLVSREMARGVQAGESRDELKARLLAAFGVDSHRYDFIRDRVAATEATRAFNHGVFVAAEAAAARGATVVKQWITRRDRRVREAHADASGQIQLYGDPFQVGGVPMAYPGDPTAPASLTVNCRCIMRTSVAEGNRNVGQNVVSADGSDAFRSNMPPQLKRYWLRGEGAAKIRWGTPGAFDRCVRNLRDDFPQNTEGLCANLYREATGRWPGSRRGKASVARTSATVALVPTEEDAARLALEGGEDASELHLTLAYLGEAADWTEEGREAVTDYIHEASATLLPVVARVFGGAYWNPDGDEPAWVWNVGDDRDGASTPLAELRDHLLTAVTDGFDLPVQHSPWVPHVCACYGGGDRTADLASRVGPVTFDRVRVAFGGEYVDLPLSGFVPGMLGEDDAPEEDQVSDPLIAAWSTPGTSALAFENQQTGDGRVFAPGALEWGDGPWPLMAKDTFASHEDAELAGAIHTLGRDGNRITGSGVLYLNQDAGRDSFTLLSQGAPLGVSVDLDDVDLEVVYAGEDEEGPVGKVVASTRLVTASLLPLPDDGYVLCGVTEPDITAASDDETVVIESASVVFHVGPGGTVPVSAFEIEAAAGDAGPGGTVLDTQRSGDHLIRITRARLRGATLVNLPAFEGARIVLDLDDPYALAASDVMPDQVGDYDRVVRYARKHVVPVTAAEVAKFLALSVVSVRRHLTNAVRKGDLVRLVRGKYVAPERAAEAAEAMAASSGADELPQTLTAAVTGSVNLPVANRDTEWDGDGAKDRVFTFAEGDTAVLADAFAYRDDEKDPADKAAYKLGYADVISGELTIVPRGVAAARAAMNGARGGVDLPDNERGAVGRKLSDVQAHVDEVTGEEEMDRIEASAWTAMKNMPPMPAAWFAEPTAEELPPGGPGVNYVNGRIFGWVAQAGEPHAGYARKLTIESLGNVDTTHFLRQRFTLDDGSVVRAGAYTMNAGHHRDGAECETSACQFDDSRTVAGIVTVGMNDRGMWFSGAAAPWLSDWDRSVFMATQPSYHMRKAAGGWQLRAVLAVPVPGHSSPLLASAVVERSQVALTAAAAMAPADTGTPTPAAQVPDLDTVDYDKLADAIVAATARAEQRRAAEAAELAALMDEARKLDGDETGTEGT